MDFLGAAIRTFFQIAVVIIVSFILHLAACFFIAIANGVPFGEMFAELNSGVSPFSLVALFVLGYVGVFMINLGLCDDPPTDERQNESVIGKQQ